MNIVMIFVGILILTLGCIGNKFEGAFTIALVGLGFIALGIVRINPRRSK